MIPHTIIPIRHHRVEILHVEIRCPEIGAVVLHAYPACVRAEIVQIERRVHVSIEPFRSKGTVSGGITCVENAGVYSVAIDVSEVVSLKIWGCQASRGPRTSRWAGKGDQYPQDCVCSPRGIHPSGTADSR